jgi:hypothetical protein
VFENQDLFVNLNETVIDGRRAQSRGLPDLLDLRHSFLELIGDIVLKLNSKNLVQPVFFLVVFPLKQWTSRR